MPRKKSLPFRPKARLMLLLGDQLIRDAGIAVFELVKNAYDADARKCEVKLISVDQDSEDASIIVKDNGQGMSYNTVAKVWLEPATENRKLQREAGERSPKYKRLPLGEKGVGRFAVHKLGKRVELVTRAEGSEEVVVLIDWDRFEKDVYLSQVPVRVSTREPRVFKGSATGTRIKISDLRERPWTRRRARSLHRAMNAICSPFGGPRSFRPSLIIEPENDWLKGLLIPKDVLEQAIFKFEGTIKGKTLRYNYTFRPRLHLERVDSRESTQKLAIRPERSRDENGRQETEVVNLIEHGIGPVNISFYIFDREPSVLKLTATDVSGLKDFLDFNGGVLVYRDGVRVYDYGEPGNDWLDLGGRRVNVPAKRIGNNQILGIVRLSLESSPGLIEKTNREGFVENNAYVAFRDAIRFAIKQAEIERNQDKDRIRRAYRGGNNKAPVLDEIEELRTLAKKRKLEKELSPYLNRIESQFKDVRDRLLVAAGAGLNLGIVIHEVEKRIMDLLEAVKHNEGHAGLLERAKSLADMVEGFAWLTRSAGPTMVQASTLIKQAIVNWQFRFKHHEIEVVNGILSGDQDFTFKCQRRLFTGALMNLIDNAIYWLGSRTKNRKLYLGTSKELNGLSGIVIADNGPGFVDPPHFVIEPFVTRKPDGIGLGLHIADEVMKLHQGKLRFPEKGDISLPPGFSGAVLFMECGPEE